jgi:tRNA nucleotidyltransferase (CCA-adding enzyme)
VQIFLVGGAVRDKLLKYPVKDCDWVVTGATVEQMLSLGFQQVGKDFPVFLHPESKQEHALARKEKKSGVGYTGFVCDFSPEVTLEEDLLRRDLTINAMAEDADGTIIDPCNGQQDLSEKRLRHVSPAFSEDPLRVLRVARFAARYAHLDFSIADETLELMRNISNTGELQTLTPERVWEETRRAITELTPSVFFETLREVGALKELFPELDCLWGVPNPEKWHPEIDTGIHTMMVLQQACLLSDETEVRYAALVHDLGKGCTPSEQWPHHRGHEKLGLKPIKALSDRLKVPNDYRNLALIVSEYHTHCHRAFELKPSTIIKMFDAIDAWRRPERFIQFLTVCKADMRGRTGFEQAEYPQTDYLEQAFNIARDVNVKEIVELGFTGKEIKSELTSRRVTALADFKALYPKG